MRFNWRSLIFLKNLAKRKQAADRSATADDTVDTGKVKSRTRRFTDWLTPKPADIAIYNGETELFRKGPVLVTDTRLAYIDPFDRMLKTYMFEHMISVHKHFYRSTTLNRRLCKFLLLFSCLALLVIIVIDLLDSKSSGFLLVYVPILACIFIGLKVWNDMKPRYVLHWRMRDVTYGEIVQEPLFRERITGNLKREQYMNELADAMNQALSAKAWWPNRASQLHSTTGDASDAGAGPGGRSNRKPAGGPGGKPSLELVTENYQ